MIFFPKGARERGEVTLKYHYRTKSTQRVVFLLQGHYHFCRQEARIFQVIKQIGKVL